MLNLRIIAIVVAGSLSLAGCLADGTGAKQATGTLLGAAGGALLGSQFGNDSTQPFFTIGGGLLGALLGNEIGQSLDRADQAYAAEAEVQALDAPVGHTVTWNNPKSGNRGSYTATRDGVDNHGRYCREYQMLVMIGNETEEAYGTACMQPDGTWEIVG